MATSSRTCCYTIWRCVAAKVQWNPSVVVGHSFSNSSSFPTPPHLPPPALPPLISSRPYSFSSSTRQQQRLLRYAVLVDAENTQPTKLRPIVEEVISLGGESIVRRVYGDLSSQHLLAWKRVCLDSSFVPVNAISYISGKGTSDSALIIDAMELLYTNPHIDAFALVSSDSDFTRLAQKLRESGKHVIGFGSKQTPFPFVQAVERFIHVENLESTSDNDLINTNKGTVVATTRLVSSAGNKIPKKDIELLQRIVEYVADYDVTTGRWAFVSTVSARLIAVKSDFDARNYGYNKFSKLLFDLTYYFELMVADDGLTLSIRNRQQKETLEK